MKYGNKAEHRTIATDTGVFPVSLSIGRRISSNGLANQETTAGFAIIME